MDSIRRNFIWNVLFQLLRIALPIVLTPHVVRALGSDGVGVYSYTYSIAYYFTLFCLLGMNQYGNREIAKVRDNFEDRSRVFSSIYCMQLITTALVSITYSIYLFFAPKTIQPYLAIWVVWIVAESLNINWLFFGLEEFGITVVRNSVIRIITVAIVILLVRDRDDIWLYCLIQAISFLISYVVLLPFAIKRVKFVLPDLKSVLVHAKPNLLLFAPIVAISLYTQFGKILLGRYANMSQVAFFDSSEKIIQIPLAIVQALGTVMLPRMTSLNSRGDRNELSKLLAISTRLMTIMSIAFTFGICAVAQDFVPIFFGPGFEECEILIYILSITIPVIGWSNVLGVQCLLPSGRDFDYTITVIIGAIVSMSVNAIAIPRMQSIGASIAALLAEFSVTVSQMVLLRDEIHYISEFMYAIPYTIIGLIMFVSVRFVSSWFELSIAKLGIEIVVGITAYTTLVALWAVLSRDRLLFTFFSSKSITK